MTTEQLVRDSFIGDQRTIERPDSAHAILLENPKTPFNVGTAIRAAAGYGVGRVYWSGDRVWDQPGSKYRLPREERMRDYNTVKRERVDDLRRIIAARPQGMTVVAVEVLPDAESLLAFEHPEHAMYVFGPEDGTITKELRLYCHRFVVIPTEHCINLAAAVYTVLYDRRLKQFQRGEIGSHEVVP